MRVVEARGDYVALCPYAPRVPYETWILPRTHEAGFERTALVRPDKMGELAAILRRTLQRISTMGEDFHLVLLTTPNSLHPSKTLGFWKTIEDDINKHVVIMHVISSHSRLY